jgi:hypothetical protein
LVVSVISSSPLYLKRFRIILFIITLNFTKKQASQSQERLVNIKGKKQRKVKGINLPMSVKLGQAIVICYCLSRDSYKEDILNG